MRRRSPMPDLERYLRATEGAAFRLSARVLGVDEARPCLICSRLRRAGLRARPSGAASRPARARRRIAQQCACPGRHGVARRGAPPCCHARLRPFCRQSCPSPSWSPIWRLWRGRSRHRQREGGDISADARVASLVGQHARAHLSLVPRQAEGEAWSDRSGGFWRWARFAARCRRPAVSQGQPLPVPRISWHVENSFRFFTDAADTEVHRATYLALPPEARLQQPVLAAEQALSRRHEEGWAATMFRNTCWDVRTNRFTLSRRRGLHQSEVASRHRQHRQRRRGRAPRLHLAHGAARGQRPARQGRHPALQRVGAVRHSLPGRHHREGRDRRTRGGERGHPRARSAGRRHGRQHRVGRRQPRRSGALLARACGELRQALGGRST